MNNETLKIIKDGLWTNNPALVQVCLCPSLAVTSTLTNALGLGLASLFVLTIQPLCFTGTQFYSRRHCGSRFS